MYEVEVKFKAPFICNLDLECAWSSHGSGMDNAMGVKLQTFLTVTKISNSVMNDKGKHVCFHILVEEH